jgi:hypothetical protein
MPPGVTAWGPMDGFQFIASIVGSLAWPTVVVIVLWLNRHRIANLPGWLEEMTLPGGTKLTFRKENAKATLTADRVIELKAPSLETGKPQLGEPRTIEEELDRLVMERPDLAVLDSFRDIEGTLGQIRSHMVGFPGKEPTAQRVLPELLRGGIIDEDVISLYESLRSARNAVAHGRSAGSPSVEEARLFVRNAQILNSRLRTALETLKQS